MSAEVLREAAAVARRDWESESNGIFARAARIHLAVADWLEDTARTACVPEHHHAAIAVAHAYLDTPDRSRPGLGTADVTGGVRP